MITTSFGTLPPGYANVTREEFFRLLKLDSRDIMPSHDAPDLTTWRVVATRTAWGISAPGWKNPHAHPPCYAVDFANLPLAVLATFNSTTGEAR